MKIKHYQPITYVTVGLLCITILAGLLLTCNIPIFPGMSIINPNNASAETSTATIRVKSTCSMTATVNTDHTASLINGVYSGDYVDTTEHNKIT